MAQQHLKARYAAPNSSKSFQAELPPLASDANAQTVEDKTAYLSALRAGIVQVQGEVNAFLTQRMEDEKASEASGKKTREQKEEEMYGEEDPEEEG